jgi:hypothetical protein
MTKRAADVVVAVAATVWTFERFGETVNKVFMKKALARFQPIFKPKSSGCHPRTCLLARMMTQSISQPQSSVPMVAKTSR